jgi:hypothetical protein
MGLPLMLTDILDLNFIGKSGSFIKTIKWKLNAFDQPIDLKRPIRDCY